MINTKMMLGVVVVATTLLVGCSKQTTVDSSVTSQLTQLANDVRMAKAEADRANQRLDNLTTGYRK